MMVGRLAICAIFKNEARYLLEWIAWHRVIGFDHIVLYDNGSDDGGADIVRQSAFADHVTIVDWPERPGQLSAYRHFVQTHARTWEWVAFIDIDEFLVPLRDTGIRRMIERLSAFSVILVQGRVFGPSGWVERPEGLVLEAYTMRMPDDAHANRRVKSIVKTVDLLGVRENPHEFRVKGPACNTRGELAPNIAIQPTECHVDLVVNHYQTRSHADWAEKVARGSATSSIVDDPAYPLELIDHFVAQATEHDTSVQPLLPIVRAALGLHAEAEVPAVADTEEEAEGEWFAESDDVWLHTTGMAMVCRDVSRKGGMAGGPWYAALRGEAAGLLDPTYLLDEDGRIFDFPSAREACSACDIELAALREA